VGGLRDGALPHVLDALAAGPLQRVLVEGLPARLGGLMTNWDAAAFDIEALRARHG
jgi:hypothetical protein